MDCRRWLTRVAFVLFIAQLHGWGANRIPKRKRPAKGYLKKFPDGPTVTVSEGDSVSSAISSCDEVVGTNGYCTIHLKGNPPDSTVDIFRSRTKLTSADDVILTRSGSGTFIEIGGTANRVAVDGLDLKGHNARELYGVRIGGSATRVAVLNCKIHDFDGRENAHGIAVYGSRPKAVSNIWIANNEVYNMRTGYSESIVINGHVTRWEVSNNYVHDVNNIAIDAIGGEGTLPPSSLGDRVLPNPKDRATYGFIENNVVRRMSTRTNPNYGSKETWAAGIYIDGGHRILIQRNRVEDTPWAYEVGAENCVITKDIILKRNYASGSYYGDLLMGGYSARGFLDFEDIGCDPRQTEDAEEGHGYVQSVTVKTTILKRLTRKKTTYWSR